MPAATIGIACWCEDGSHATLRETLKCLLLGIAEHDTNGDQYINGEDAVLLYAAGPDGKSLTRLTPEGTQLTGIVADGNDSIYVRVLRDSNGDRRFTEEDEALILRVDLRQGQRFARLGGADDVDQGVVAEREEIGGRAHLARSCPTRTMTRVKKTSRRPTRKHSVQKPIRPDEVPKLEAAMRFVRKNFANGIVLQDAADVAGTSRFHFLRRFKLHFGKTAKAVAAECQIEAAKRRLLSGAKGTRVAKACGYSHQSHFSMRFVKAVGMTPAQWAAKQKHAGGK